MDDDGYPTEETLEIIRTWPWPKREGWFEYIASMWRYPNAFTESQVGDKVTWHVSTLGWSGNEELISAMQENYLMWAITWVQSRRGGHYIFEVPSGN